MSAQVGEDRRSRSQYIHPVAVVDHHGPIASRRLPDPTSLLPANGRPTAAQPLIPGSANATVLWWVLMAVPASFALSGASIIRRRLGGPSTDILAACGGPPGSRPIHLVIFRLTDRSGGHY